MRVNGDRRPSAPWCRSAAGLGRFSSAVMAPVKGISCARLRSRAAITSCIITTSTSSTPRWRPAHRDHHQRRLHVQALPQGRTSARSSGIAVFDNRSSVRPAPHLSPIWRFSIFIGAGSTKPRRLRLIFSGSRASSTIPRSLCRPIFAPGQWAGIAVYSLRPFSIAMRALSCTTKNATRTTGTSISDMIRRYALTLGAQIQWRSDIRRAPCTGMTRQ